jgi:aminoglycoside phosphotransferase (APT) family kinase protein
LSKTGTLPVACPLLIEREISEVGAPFMITSRLPGTAPGSWQGFFPDTPRALVESLARLLAAVHTVDFSTLPLPGANRSSEELLEEEVQFRWAKWKRDATSASPIVECAFAWLLAECRSGLGAATLVHGDVLPHNILANQDQVSGLVDWEFAHIGDPAEDLAYCREAVIGVMPWNDFLAVYHAAGGRQVDEHRLAVFSIYGRLRNISFAASAAGAFRNGVSTDFAIGASGCIVPPIYEALIGNALLKYV